MKKFLFLLAFAANSAFACHTPTCTSTPTISGGVTTGITGNVSNTEAGISTSSIGSGGGSFAAVNASVSETATGSTTGYSSRNSGPNGSIAGSTSTYGSASVTGMSASVGTGQAMTNGVAYGTANATATENLKSTSPNATLNLSGSAASANQVGVGYATQSSGNGFDLGGASVNASSGSAFSANGIVNACNTPINGNVSDSKSGYTLTNAPVIQNVSIGSASGGAFSPFINNTTATATQTATVTGSFSATK